jgi:D-alanyl-lipoteichoic acid acyltransferase DltB (MBOAT superfamily)
MLFNSWAFLSFFVIVWGLYISLSHKYQNILLWIASYVFYGWWDWRFLLLLVISTVVDFYCAKGIERQEKNKAWYLSVSLVVDIGILCFFKYFNFFAASTAQVLSAVGFQADLPTLNILLPVGISFYTFQTMAYTIDVYRGKEKAVDDLLAFAIYVAYFPQLVAGPIERSTHLLPQIQKPRQISASQIYRGLQLVLVGYFKKVFIADGVAPIVDRCFSDPEKYSGIALLCGVYLFALQIYGDFSGYTDIARGISRMFGIELRLNFKQPYLSSNITEFWQRWHMSLSGWLKDYLYIPLGGNRRGDLRTYLNLMMVMLLGGLWHGAGWNFVAWGGLHGIYLVFHKLLLRGRKVGFSKPPRSLIDVAKWLLGAVITFNLVCIAWVFFRADSWSNAISYLHHMTRMSGNATEMVIPYLLFYSIWILALDLLCWYRDDELAFGRSLHPAIRGLAYAVMMILLVYVGENRAQPFIYFQF